LPGINVFSSLDAAKSEGAAYGSSGEDALITMPGGVNERGIPLPCQIVAVLKDGRVS
jgi:hypothetical protein